ncbi:MAG: hypothetical protein ACOYN4_03570 [Bacteroidales bacterium]
MELYLPRIRKKKRNHTKIAWTEAMLTELIELFPVTFNKELARKMGISTRSLIRKARQLSLGKEPGFLESRREAITSMAKEAHPPHPHKGQKGWCVPNSEQTRYKKGNIPALKINPEIVKKVHRKRNLTIHRDRIRIKYNLPRLTKLKLKQ